MAHAPKDSLDETDSKTGEFKRSESGFRHWIRADGSTDFKPEASRYLLYVSYGCPWASRCLMLRSLKGLEEVVDVCAVAPVWGHTNPGVDEHRGWMFADTSEEKDCQPDPLFGARSLRDVYEKLAGKGATPKFTVPLLVDRKLEKIVNNESAEIIQMFNNEFNALAKNPDVNMFPEEHLAKMEELNSWIYEDINNGYYRCGFATKQGAYDDAMVKLYAALDRCEEILSTSRFLCGNRLTASDIRLFVSLVRADPVYAVHFKTNKKLIREYPALWAFTRDVYQLANLKSTVVMDHIKRHYMMSHPQINKYGIVAMGKGGDEGLSEPHDRASLGEALFK